MATFCMFSPEECDRLAFDSFDTDRDGVLRGDELQKMIRATEKERAGATLCMGAARHLLLLTLHS